MQFKRYENLYPFFDEICKLLYVLDIDLGWAREFKAITEDEFHASVSSRWTPWKRNYFYISGKPFLFCNCPFEFEMLRTFAYLPFGKQKKTLEEMTSEDDKKTLRRFNALKKVIEEYYSRLLTYHSDKPSITDWSKTGWNHYALDPRLYLDLYNWLRKLAKNPIMKYSDIYNDKGEMYWWTSILKWQTRVLLPYFVVYKPFFYTVSYEEYYIISKDGEKEKKVRYKVDVSGYSTTKGIYVATVSPTGPDRTYPFWIGEQPETYGKEKFILVPQYIAGPYDGTATLGEITLEHKNHNEDNVILPERELSFSPSNDLNTILQNSTIKKLFQRYNMEDRKITRAFLNIPDPLSVGIHYIERDDPNFTGYSNSIISDLGGWSELSWSSFLTNWTIDWTPEVKAKAKALNLTIE